MGYSRFLWKVYPNCRECMTAIVITQITVHTAKSKTLTQMKYFILIIYFVFLVVW